MKLLQTLSVIFLLFMSSCKKEEIVPQVSPTPLSGIVPERIDHLGGVARYSTHIQYINCVLWEYNTLPFENDPIASQFDFSNRDRQFEYYNEKISKISVNQNDYEIFVYDETGQLEKSTRFRRDTTGDEFSTVMDRVYTFEADKIVRIEDSVNDRIETFSYFEGSGNLQSVLTHNAAGVLLSDETFFSYDTMNNPNKNLPLIHLDISQWIRKKNPNNNLEKRVRGYGNSVSTYNIFYSYTYNNSGYPMVRNTTSGSLFISDVFHYTSCGE